MRNQIQHDKQFPFPIEDVEKAYKNVQDFLKLILNKVYNLKYENLSLLDLIHDEDLKINLGKSKDLWEQDDKSNAMFNIKNSFDNAMYKYIYPIFSQQYVDIDLIKIGPIEPYEIKFSLIRSIESSIISSIGIDVIKWQAFKDIMKYIPGEYIVDYRGGPVFRDNENFESDQMTFCFDFVLDAIVIMQEKGRIAKLKDIHRYFSSHNLPDFTHVTFNKLPVPFNSRCYTHIGLDSHNEVYGFETDNIDVVSMFKQLSIGDEIEIDSRMVCCSGKSISVLTNDPPRWRIVIGTKNIPTVTESSEEVNDPSAD
ncbi:hypothetical protein [Brevibacillus dissolubilis]|uniref:hypothetical protein n=1 Tax=Brevibacillus dissolubilis TaxID=1844116 RepID=UPI0011161D27|nr:hypothetical protein [Brevibacillus dissolubilis]